MGCVCVGGGGVEEEGMGKVRWREERAKVVPLGRRQGSP
jgi:hypothetical protein